MASADDDAVLNSFLDDLITSARTDVETTKADATTSQHDQTFTPNNLHEALEAANLLLHSVNLPYLPSLIDSSTSTLASLNLNKTDLPNYHHKDNINDDGDDSFNNQQAQRPRPNIQSVLSATLTTLVRVLRANAANISIRQRAEASLQHTEMELQSSQTTLSTLHTRLESVKDSAASSKRKYDAVLRTRDTDVKKSLVETAELRAKLQTAVTREKALAQEVQKRDKETALLKQRVHALISAPRGAPVLQRITTTGGFGGSGVKRVIGDSKKEVRERAKAIEEARLRVVEDENKVFRDLLRAVQEELDDLIVACDDDHDHDGSGVVVQNDKVSESVTAITEKIEEERKVDGEGNADREVGDMNTATEANEKAQDGTGDGKELAEGTPWETILSTRDVAPAPTEDQMRLPFDMIREEFEESLEKKFLLIRTALTDS